MSVLYTHSKFHCFKKEKSDLTGLLPESEAAHLVPPPLLLWASRHEAVLLCHSNRD